jgi:phospholipase C
MPDGDPIKHVIVLMLENRSFDHMLVGLAGSITGLDGVPQNGTPPSNRDHDGWVKIALIAV